MVIEMSTFMNFPKRDELLFLVVLAFPKASRTGLVARIREARSDVRISMKEGRMGRKKVEEEENHKKRVRSLVHCSLNLQRP